MTFSFDIETINRELISRRPQERIEWALAKFQSAFCITSSFGIHAAVMVHLVSQVDPAIPVLFMDTGYHFAETLAYKEYLQKLLHLNVITIKPDLTRMEFEQKFGYANENNHDVCCRYNKVNPFQRALEQYECWAAGIRRCQGGIRAQAPVLTTKNGSSHAYKLAPIVEFTDADMEAYIMRYQLPRHPLVRKGYTSVGCVSCTQRTAAGEDARAGRWRGTDKKECGIHYLHGNGDGI